MCSLSACEGFPHDFRKISENESQWWILTQDDWPALSGKVQVEASLNSELVVNWSVNLTWVLTHVRCIRESELIVKSIETPKERD